MTSSLTFACLFCLAALPASAQVAPAPGAPPGSKPYDINIYPALNSQGGLYDLNVANAQKGPPGTVAMTSSAPPPDYSFADIMANTHGYVSAGLSSNGGHGFEGAVSIPLVPGKAELELAAGTGQTGSSRFSGGGRTPNLTYDTYSAGLTLHPADNVEAYIGVSAVRLHGSGLGYGYGYGNGVSPYLNAY